MHVEEILNAIPPLAVYMIVGAVIGFESLGIPLPGEIVLVSASLLASQHDSLNPVWIGVCATTGAIVGDSIGYAIGRRGGPRLFAWAGRKFPKHFGPEHIDRARGVFRRRGVWAVFFGRFVALLRILAGPLAGSLHMPYGKFLVANAAGGIVWAGGTTAAVYYLGTVAEEWLSRFSWLGLVLAVVAGLVTTIVVRKRMAAHHAHKEAEHKAEAESTVSESTDDVDAEAAALEADMAAEATAGSPDRAADTSGT